MTREKMKEYLDYIPHFDGDKFADEVCDDFESRVCENCIHDNKICTYQESIKVYCKVTRGEDYVCDFRDFGCNRFRRKIDEQK